MVRASSMLRPLRRRAWEQWKTLGSFRCGVEPVNGAGSDTGLHRIHQDDRGKHPSRLPANSSAVASFLHDREAREILAAQAANDDTTHTVVAAGRVAHPISSALLRGAVIRALPGVQEVRSAGDAGIVVADGLFALPLQAIVGRCRRALTKSERSSSDGFQVLGGRRIVSWRSEMKAAIVVTESSDRGSREALRCSHVQWRHGAVDIHVRLIGHFVHGR